MSRYRDIANPSYNWAYRVPITIDCTGGAATKDVTVAIPQDWDFFWTTVRSGGEDVRVTNGDGVTLATFDLQSWNATTRTCTLEIQNFVAAAAKVYKAWLYWGQASCSTGATVFALGASPFTGYVNLMAPREPIITAGAERPGETKARQSVAKQSSDVQVLWFNFTPLLRDRAAPHGGGLELEEILYASVSVTANGTDDSARYTIASTRHHARGWISIEVKAGSSGTTYTAQVEVVTTSGPNHAARTFRASARLYVQNPTE